MDVNISSELWLTSMEKTRSSAVHAAVNSLRRWNRSKTTQSRILLTQFQLRKHQLLQFSRDLYSHSNSNKYKFQLSKELLHRTLGWMANQMATPDLLRSRMEMAKESHECRLSPVKAEVNPKSILETWTTSTWILVKETHSKACSGQWQCHNSSHSKMAKNNHKAAASANSSSRVFHQWRKERKMTATFALRKSAQTETKVVNYLVDMLSTKLASAHGWRITTNAHAAGQN